MNYDILARCSVTETLKLFAAKWKPCIICHLDSGPKRFGELQRLISNISRRMLTQHLNELQNHGLIIRKSFAVIPPHVEYSLTEKGRSLIPLLETIQDWGMTHLDDVKTIDEMVHRGRMNSIAQQN